MEASTEAWRLTLPTLKFIAKEKFKLAKPHSKPKQSQPQLPDNQPKPEIISEEKKPECNQDTPCCTTCRYVKSKTCGSDKPGLRCKKPAPVVIPSAASISKSVRANCRHCCCTFCQFLKEAYKTTQGDPKARVCDVLAEVSDILLAIANDCVLFVRRIGVTTKSMAQNGFEMAKNKVRNLRTARTSALNVSNEKPILKGVLKTEKSRSIGKLKGKYSAHIDAKIKGK